jgi:hypothetical protein
MFYILDHQMVLDRREIKKVKVRTSCVQDLL